MGGIKISTFFISCRKDLLQVEADNEQEAKEKMAKILKEMPIEELVKHIEVE